MVGWWGKRVQLGSYIYKMPSKPKPSPRPPGRPKKPKGPKSAPDPSPPPTPEQLEADNQRVYTPDMADRLREHMSKGYSFESFGAEPGLWVSRESLRLWLDKYPEFRQAREEGRAAARKFYEGRGMEGMSEGKLFNERAWMFLAKNVTGMRENPLPEGLETADFTPVIALPVDDGNEV